VLTMAKLIDIHIPDSIYLHSVGSVFKNNILRVLNIKTCISKHLIYMYIQFIICNWWNEKVFIIYLPVFWCKSSFKGSILNDKNIGSLLPFKAKTYNLNK
jgi:hypothetical protein